MTARIGLLGVAGPHVDAYVDNLLAAHATLVGVTDADQVRGPQWAAWRGVRWFDNPGSLLAAGVDGIVVCSETARHRRLVEAAAAAGAAVLCDKPLATAEHDSAAIVAACRAAGVPLMTAFPMRFSQVMREGIAEVRRGSLGAVLSAVGVNQGRLPTAERLWLVDPTLSGGGALIDRVVALADVLRWLFGSDPVEVYAVANRVLHSQVDSVETGGLVALTFADGVFATIDGSWSRPEEFPTHGAMALDVVCERGVVRLDVCNQLLTIYGGQRGDLDRPAWRSDANQAMIDEFLAVCAGRVQPRVTGEDGHAATRIALAAMESSRTGLPVPLASNPLGLQQQ